MFEIGFTYRADYHDSIVANSDRIDFLEIIPDGLDLHDGSEETRRIRSLSKLLPFTAHSIDLSIASTKDDEYFEHFNELLEFIKVLNVSHYSDHLAYTRAGRLNCDAYVPPLYGIENVDNLARRIAPLLEKLSAIGATFALENVANTVLADRSDPSREGVFMRELSDATDISYILNIDSLLISSGALGISPIELLRTYPVERIDSVTIVPPDAMNVVMNEQYGVLVREEALSVFEAALELIDPRRVVIQVRYPHNTLDTQLEYINRLRSIRSTQEYPAQMALAGEDRHAAR